MKEEGFSLVEVLVALVVISLGAMALLTSMNYSIKNENQLRDKFEAQIVAHNQMVLLKTGLVEPKLSNKVTLNDKKWFWYLKRLEDHSQLDLLTYKVSVSGSSVGHVVASIVYYESAANDN